jgi:phenylacetate-CoA oxygenase PaaI subunit
MSIQTVASYQRVEELEPGVADALLQWGLSLADTKHRLGIRTSEWVNGGPALEAAVGASAMTQDELGHARSLYAILKEFPGAPPGIGAENDLLARHHYFCPPLLNERWPSWVDVIAVNVLLDRATMIAVTAARDSAYLPLKGRTAKILQEEEFHRIFGDSWLGKLARMNEPMRGKLQASLDYFWETAVTWFGPDDDDTALTLYHNAILNATPAQMRQQWLAEVSPLLEKHSLRSNYEL